MKDKKIHTLLENFLVDRQKEIKRLIKVQKKHKAEKKPKSKHNTPDHFHACSYSRTKGNGSCPTCGIIDGWSRDCEMCANL